MAEISPPPSVSPQVISEIVADGKTTMRMAIEGLELIEQDLQGKSDDNTKVLLMWDDLETQIKMLTAMQNSLKRRIGFPQ